MANLIKLKKKQNIKLRGNHKKFSKTYNMSIYMAGDIETAKAYLRRYCYKTGFCVTITQTQFIYTGGEEAGFIVGIVNYPRFPTTQKHLFLRARKIARSLIRACCQRTALIVPTVPSDRTEWLEVRINR